MIHEMYDRLVKNKRLVLSLPLLLAAALFLPSNTVPSAHAQFTGLVCITTSTTATSCPASPPSIGPLTVGTTFSVGVFVQNSDPLAGWDVYVAVNPSFLTPTSAALGNLVTSPSLTSICINGAATTGSCTFNTANGPGVVEVTTIESSGGTDCNNPPPGPCSGMAFTITYKVVGATSSTPIFYPSATNCSPSSVTGTTECVLITNSVGTPLPETIQGATVTTTGSSAFDYSLSNNGPVSIVQGNSGTVTITASLTAGTTQPVTLSCVTPLPTGVTCSFATNPVTPTGTSLLTIGTSASTPTGSFTLKVTGSPLGTTTTATSVSVTVKTKFTGLVCITPSAMATSCPGSPPSLGPFTTGQTFTVGVFINNSAAMNGFDIYVASNPAFVNPVSAALGPLIANPSLTLICINGHLIVGVNCTVGTANGPGVVEVATLDSTGSNECGGISPCSGLAFTITYSVVAATTGTGISYPTAAGCSPSSVASPPNTCVVVFDALGTALPETVQGATVTATGAPVFDYSLSNNGPVSIVQSGSGTVTVTATLKAGTSQPVTLSCVNPPTGVTCAFATNPVTPTGTSVLTIGTSLSTPTGQITLMVTGSPLGASTTATSVTVTVQPKFTGLVCITTSTTATSCPTSPPSIGPLAVGSTFSVGVFVQNSNALVGWDMYVAVNPSFLTPTSATLGNLVTNPTLTSICINGVATTGSCAVNTSNGPGVVEVTTIEGSGMNDCNTPPGPCSGLAFTITYKVVGSAASTSIFYPSSVNCLSSVAGTNVCVFVTDSGGTTLPENIQGATVTATSDFSLSAAATSLSIPAGSSASDLLTVTSLGSFTGSVTLANSSVPSGVGVIFVPNPTAPGASSTSTMTIFLGAPAGTLFTFNVTGTSGTFSHSVSISVTVAPAPSLVKIHWTHHLSLSKTPNGTETWNVQVANPLTTTAQVVVRITGLSTINPSLTFDVTCGVTCVNTLGAVNSTPGLTPVSVASGASTSFSFNQIIPSTFVNQKFTFTVTLYWAVGTLYTAGNSKSGAFAVVP